MGSLPHTINSITDFILAHFQSVSEILSYAFFLNHYDFRIVGLSYFLLIPLTYYIFKKEHVNQDHTEISSHKFEYSFFVFLHILILSLGLTSLFTTGFLACDIPLSSNIKTPYLGLTFLICFLTCYCDLKRKENISSSWFSNIFSPSLLYSTSGIVSFYLLLIAFTSQTITFTVFIKGFFTCLTMAFPLISLLFFIAHKNSHNNKINITLLLTTLLSLFIFYLIHYSFISYTDVSTLKNTDTLLTLADKFDFAWHIILWSLFFFTGLFFWSETSKDIDDPDHTINENSLSSFIPILILFTIGTLLSFYIALVFFHDKTTQTNETYVNAFNRLQVSVENELEKKRNIIYALDSFFNSSTFVDNQEFISFLNKMNIKDNDSHFLFAPILTQETLPTELEKYTTNNTSLDIHTFTKQAVKNTLTTPVVYAYSSSADDKYIPTPKDLLRHYNFQKVIKKALISDQIVADYVESDYQIIFSAHVNKNSKKTTQRGIVLNIFDAEKMLQELGAQSYYSILNASLKHQPNYEKKYISFLGQDIPIYIKPVKTPVFYKSVSFYKTFLSGFTLVVLFSLYILTIIQQRKRDYKFQKQIESQKNMFTTILENMPLGIFVKDVKHDYKYTIINKYAETFLSRPIKDIKGRTDYEVFNERHGALIRAQDEAIIESRCVHYKDEETFSVNDGITEEIFTARSIQVPIYDDNGDAEILLNIYEDVTEKAKIRHDLIKAKEQAEKSSTIKSEFLANMSHELRTPLNSIIGLSKVLLDHKDTKPEPKEMIETITQASGALLNIVNDILDLSKVEAGKVILDKVKFNLKDSVKNTLNQMAPLAHEKELDFIVNIEESIDEKQYYYADAHRISRTLINVIGNAIKYTENGSVTVNAKVSFHPEKSDFDTFKISVQDTGIGIDETKTSDIFESFTQADASIERKFGGTGLGLNITKKILEIMDGSISVESKLGEGSCFTIQIPLQKVTEDELALKPNEDSSDEISNFDDYRVLIAEDQEFNNVLMKVLLKKYNLKDYTICLNGVQVIDEVVKSKDGYDLILMDCHMPEMDGYKASNSIRELDIKSRSGEPIPIIALTADVTSGIKQKCYDSGMNDYLSKPLDEDLFIKMIKKYL